MKGDLKCQERTVLDHPQVDRNKTGPAKDRVIVPPPGKGLASRRAGRKAHAQ